MLRVALRAVVSLTLLFGTVMTGSGGATADSGPGGGVWNCASDVICGEAHDPGTAGHTASGGSHAGSGGKEVCRWNGQEVPCYRDDAGWFNPDDGCYYRKADPPPAEGDPAWEGHKPSDGGAVYFGTCFLPGGATTTGVAHWFRTPPVPQAPPSPAELARQAMFKIVFGHPALHTAPGRDGKPLVGMGLWLWYDPAEAIQGPNAASASAGGVTVTATATLQYVEWSMDDGSGPKRCDGPGTPYRADYGAAESPDCGYRYAVSSAGRPGDAFTVSAVLHWRITATIDGTGTQPVDPQEWTTDSELLQLPVGELQVLN